MRDSIEHNNNNDNNKNNKNDVMIMIIVVIMIIITMKIHYVILKVKISFVAVNRGYVSYTRSSVSSKLYVRSLVNYTPIQE